MSNGIPASYEPRVGLMVRSNSGYAGNCRSIGESVELHQKNVITVRIVLVEKLRDAEPWERLDEPGDRIKCAASLWDEAVG